MRGVISVGIIVAILGAGRYCFSEGNSFGYPKDDQNNFLSFGQGISVHEATIRAHRLGSMEKVPYVIRDRCSDSLAGISWLEQSGTDSAFVISGMVGGSAEARDVFKGSAKEIDTTFRKNNLFSAAGHCIFPYRNMWFFGRYIKDNLYTTEFDRYRSNYKEIMGSAMANAKAPQIAVVDAGYGIVQDAVSASLMLSKGRGWEATPYYYTPVFTEGYCLTPTVRIGNGADTLIARYRFSNTSWFWNRIDPREFSDNRYVFVWKRGTGNGLAVSLTGAYDSRFKPSGMVSGSIGDTLGEFSRWIINTTVFGNFRAAADFFVAIFPLPHWELAIKPGFFYYPQERGYTFTEMGKPVDYVPSEYEQFQIHSSLAFQDTIFFPLQARLIFDAANASRWNAITRYPGRTIINQERIDSVRSYRLNGIGSYILTYKTVSAKLWGELLLVEKNRYLDYSIPKKIGIDLKWEGLGIEGSAISLGVETRDRLTAKYYLVTEKKVEEKIVSAQTLLKIHGRVPFSMPLYKKGVKGVVTISADPLRVAPTMAVPLFLGDNPVGSTFSLAIALQLR